MLGNNSNNQGNPDEKKEVGDARPAAPRLTAAQLTQHRKALADVYNNTQTMLMHERKVGHYAHFLKQLAFEQRVDEKQVDSFQKEFGTELQGRINATQLNFLPARDKAQDLVGTLTTDEEKNEEKQAVIDDHQRKNLFNKLKTSMEEAFKAASAIDAAKKRLVQRAPTLQARYAAHVPLKAGEVISAVHLETNNDDVKKLLEGRAKQMNKDWVEAKKSKGLGGDWGAARVQITHEAKGEISISIKTNEGDTKGAARAIVSLMQQAINRDPTINHVSIDEEGTLAQQRDLLIMMLTHIDADVSLNHRTEKVFRKGASSENLGAIEYLELYKRLRGNNGNPPIEGHLMASLLVEMEKARGGEQSHFKAIEAGVLDSIEEGQMKDVLLVLDQAMAQEARQETPDQNKIKDIRRTKWHILDYLSHRNSPKSRKAIVRDYLMGKGSREETTQGMTALLRVFEEVPIDNELSPADLGHRLLAGENKADRQAILDECVAMQQEHLRNRFVVGSARFLEAKQEQEEKDENQERRPAVLTITNQQSKNAHAFLKKQHEKTFIKIVQAINTLPSIEEKPADGANNQQANVSALESNQNLVDEVAKQIRDIVPLVKGQRYPNWMIRSLPNNNENKKHAAKNQVLYVGELVQRLESKGYNNNEILGFLNVVRDKIVVAPSGLQEPKQAWFFSVAESVSGGGVPRARYERMQRHITEHDGMKTYFTRFFDNVCYIDATHVPQQENGNDNNPRA